MGQEEEPQKIPTNEVSEEGKIHEEPQQISHDTKVRTVDSMDIENPDVDPSQKKKTLERSDKWKSIAEQNPFSSKLSLHF